MYAQMGMKIEEWENGQVNIGIAVCPTKPTAIAAALAGTKEGRLFMASAPSDNFIVVPKSAFIIRPAGQDQSQGGISVTYAHQLQGPSNFIIMLNPQDQGYQDLINYNTEQSDFHTMASTGITDSKSMNLSGKVQVDSVEDISTKHEANPVISEREDSQSDPGVEEREQEESNRASSEESLNLKLPQDTEKAAVTPDSEATGSLEREEISLHPRRSGDMKRVSWVEEIEKLENNKGTGTGIAGKENRKDSVRKLNVRNNNNRSIPGRKQHGFSSEDATSGTSTTGYTKGEKKSGEKSRIPLITASAGDYPTSCEFYRRQMLRECMSYNPNTLADNWYGYGTSLQKYAGQKVVKKIAAEQKRLEEDISNRRKTEIWILGNEADDFMMSPISVPLRKRTMRLKPMQIVH